MKLAGTVVPILLVILALVSAVSIGLTTTSYLEGMGAAGSLSLELSDLQLKEGDEPEVAITFHLENHSLLNIELERFNFSVYLSGEFVGSNYEPFTAKTLEGLEKVVMRFRIPLKPFYIQYVERAQQENRFSWSISGRVKLVLPFREDVVWLNLRESWSGE